MYKINSNLNLLKMNGLLNIMCVSSIFLRDLSMENHKGISCSQYPSSWKVAFNENWHGSKDKLYFCQKVFIIVLNNCRLRQGHSFKIVPCSSFLFSINPMLVIPLHCWVKGEIWQCMKDHVQSRTGKFNNLFQNY